MNETLQKSLQSVHFVLSGLREALADSTAVETILLLQMIDRAAGLQRSIGELLGARTADEEAAK